MLSANPIICGHKLTTRLFCLKICLTRANYYYRQYFFSEQKKLNFTELYHQVSKSDDYQALPTKISKQIIRRLDKSWTSYFAALREWKKQPNKFIGKPKIPKYKHKTCMPKYSALSR